MFTFTAMVAKVWLLSKAIKSPPLRTSSAVWTDIGVVGAMVVGIVFFGGAVTVPRMVSVTLIAVGLIALKAFTLA